MEPTQAYRRVAIATGLGEDVLLLRSLRGEERLGRVFSYHLDLAAVEPIDFDAFLGTSVCVRVSIGNEIDEDQDDAQRYINGYVSSCEYVERSGRYLRYQAEVVPWLWFLSRSIDCKIYQEQSVPDIIKSVFRDCGFSDFEDKLTAGAYEPWEYCVQYRESHLRFVQRLMEQEGIYYYFRHEADKHTLVLCDGISAHEPHPAAGELLYDYETREEGERISTGMVTAWRARHTVQPGAYAHRDFDFKLPNNDLLARSENYREHANNVGEVYDYPGEYVQQSTGEALAARRLEEIQVECETFRGEVTSRALACGATFALEDHPQESLNGEYLVLASAIEVLGDAYESTAGGAAGGGGGEDFFRCSVEAIRKETPFRPRRITERPTIAGPQTAIVVGKENEEITVDEHGRVHVQFHWDRDAPGDETASCWVRVSQGWAGKNWGAMFIPRHGHEVIVEFMEGDPDRPIITGRVYNGENHPPYDPRQHATMSTIKSNSSKGGEGFNEIRFEDKKDKEQIFVHGQRRVDVRIRGSEYETTYGSRHIRVGWEKDGDRGGDLDLFVRQHHNRHIEGDTYIWYGEESGNVYTRIEGDFKSHVVLNSEHLVKETYSLQSKDEKHQAEDLMSFLCTQFTAEGTNGVDINSGDKLFLTGVHGVHVHSSAGAYVTGGNVHIDGSSKVNIEGGSEINIKCGGSSIKLSSGGVDITGAMVKINSGGSAGPADSAEQAAFGAVLEEVEFEGPLDAIVCDDGKPGSMSGTGTRTRTRPSFSEGPMTPAPRPSPPGTETPGTPSQNDEIVLVEVKEMVGPTGSDQPLEPVENRRQYINEPRENGGTVHKDRSRVIHLRAKVRWKDASKTDSLAGKNVRFYARAAGSDEKNPQDLHAQLRAGFDNPDGGMNKTVQTDANGWTPVVKFNTSRYGGDDWRCWATLNDEDTGGLDAGQYRVWRRVKVEVDAMKRPSGVDYMDVANRVVPNFVSAHARHFTEAVRCGTTDSPAHNRLTNYSDLGTFHTNTSSDSGPRYFHLMYVDTVLTGAREEKTFTANGATVPAGTGRLNGSIDALSGAFLATDTDWIVSATWTNPADGSTGTIPAANFTVPAAAGAYARHRNQGGDYDRWTFSLHFNGSGAPVGQAVNVRIRYRTRKFLSGVQIGQTTTVAMRFRETRANGGQLNLDNATLQTSIHEASHAFGLASKQLPNGAANPNFITTGGGHCNFTTTCVMTPALHAHTAFCPKCADNYRARNLESLNVRPADNMV